MESSSDYEIQLEGKLDVILAAQRRGDARGRGLKKSEKKDERRWREKIILKFKLVYRERKGRPKRKALAPDNYY